MIIVGIVVALAWGLSLIVAIRIAYRRGGANEAEIYLQTIRKESMRKPDQNAPRRIPTTGIQDGR